MSPTWPKVGVGGVVVADGRVLLIRRGKPPLEGRWSIPGGTVELGETLEEALVREMEEETGLRVEPVLLLTALDRIEREGDRVLVHYVVLDYLCRSRSDPSRARAGSDALEARWVLPEELGPLALTARATEVVAQAFELSAGLAKGPAEE